MGSITTRRFCLGALALWAAGCDGVVGDLGSEAAQHAPPPVSAAGAPIISAFICTPQSGPAPLTSTCSITVAHSKQKPVKCTVTVNDGRVPVLNAVDCANPFAQAVTFNSPGAFAITLTVRDALEETAQEARMISVTERANQAPVVGSFVATPATGPVPLNTTFTWAVSDPDEDALSCSIDVGNDGTVEYPTLDCANASRTHTLATAGTAEVLFVVKDAKGLTSRSVVTLTARAPVGDVRIASVEWGQTVVLEALRLVQGKSALLRIHVLGDRAGLANVVVEAEGFTAAGVALGKLPLVGPATPPVAVVPADLRQQWTATVPATWVEVGFEVRVKVDPLDVISETLETNNALIVKPVVGIGNVLQLTSVPVVHQGTTAAIFDLQPGMTAFWPIKSIANISRAPYTFAANLTPQGDDSKAVEWGDLLAAIASVRTADGSNRNYYGFVRVAVPQNIPYIAGIGYLGLEAATGMDNSPDTAIHELGHNFNRRHAPCTAPGIPAPDSPDPAYPDPTGRIVSWGYNATTRALVNPATTPDLMSYCRLPWVSAYNYRAVQTRLETQPLIASQGTAMYVPVVLVSGSIRNWSEVSLRPVHRMVAARSAVADGDWAVRLVTFDGRQTVHAFTPVEVADLDEVEAHFNLTLPDPGPLAAVEVLQGATVMNRFVAQRGTAPQPELQRAGPDAVRLRWDDRQFSWAEVAHLADDGTRTTLALWLTSGDALVRTDGLTGGRFEVGLSDGINASRQVLTTER